jgi:Ser/Thr protein kinase RdoA (MazF antagonist)
MERFHGTPMDNFAELRRRGVDGELVLRRGVKVWLEAALVHGPFHGDVHAGNLLLSQECGRWVISGLVDFGDSLCGFGEYEFVAPGVLMVQGDGELQRELLLAYGYPEERLDPSLRARLMLLTILYECSDLRKYALRLDPRAMNLTLDQLERAIWRFTTG